MWSFCGGQRRFVSHIIPGTCVLLYGYISVHVLLCPMGKSGLEDEMEMFAVLFMS